MDATAPKPYCIAFGIPTTREEFFRSLSAPGSDYARRWLGDWGQYRVQFVADLDTVAPDLERAGVALVRGLRVGQLATLFANHRVVVLFSHGLATKWSSPMAWQGQTGSCLKSLPPTTGSLTCVFAIRSL